jgi:nitrite reductase/ring-hydroxylating ferredoxin subunit
MAEDTWVAAFPEAEVPAGGVRVLKRGRDQIAVFRLEDGSLHAVDNRCPHEGYPLAKGSVAGCVLTCIWHNYKFALPSGECLVGEEELRVFPLRVVDGRIEIDLTPPELGAVRARLLASLDGGLERRRLGQVARDVVRLLDAGATPASIAIEAARFDAERAEYGTTHALPVAYDVLGIVDRYPGALAALPLMQPLDIASEASQMRPRRALAPRLPDADVDTDAPLIGERLRALVEAEDADGAEALFRAAYAHGFFPREALEGWLYQLCCDHFLDFGHALIYQSKIFDLLEVAGWQHGEVILAAHLRGIVLGTREDLLPEWRHVRAALEAAAPRLAEWMSLQERADVDVAGALGADVDVEALAAVLADGERDDALAAVAGALGRGVAAERIVDAVVLAACERLQRFDVAIDLDPTVQNDWLDVTHTLTFAHAVRIALARHRRPEVLRLLFFAARFVNVSRALDAPPERRAGPAALPLPDDAAAAADAVRAAILDGDGDRAIALARGHALAGLDAAPLRAVFEDLCLADRATRPIVVAHLIKTTAVAFAEHARLAATLGRDAAARPLAALARLFTSPLRERRVARLVHEALQLVIEGKVPRSLT